jgi:hypothetical protein
MWAVDTAPDAISHSRRYSQTAERAASLEYLRSRPVAFQKHNVYCGRKPTRGLPLEPPDPQYWQTAVGYLELGILWRPILN